MVLELYYQDQQVNCSDSFILGYLWHSDRQILQEEPRNKNINIFFLSFQGGVVGYATTTHGKETQQAVIGFDMGGTSTGNHFRWLFTSGQTLLILKNSRKYKKICLF